MLKNRAAICFRVLGILSMGFLLARCGTDTKVDPTYSSLYSHFFNECGSCHVPGNDAYQNFIAVDLSGSSSSVYTNLKAAYSIAGKASCNSIKIVSPSDYDHSLIKGIAGTEAENTAFLAANGGCSPTRYRDMNHEVSAEISAALKTWVDAGALQN